MEQNYVVLNKVHNRKSGAWANNVVYQGTDRNDVYAHFGSEIGRLFNASDFDFVAVTFSDTYGNNETKFRDDRVAPEPEPNIEGGIITEESDI